MKKLLMIAVTFCLALGLGGCKAQNSATNAKEDKGNITFSNLSDDKTRNEIAALLIDNKLPKEDVEKFMNLTKEFTEISTGYQYANGFSKLPKDGVNYNTLILDNNAESYEYISWLNCRLSAFTLIKSAIETSKKANDEDTWLMFDIEALKTVDQLKLNNDELLDFITLFNNADVNDAKTQKEHENKIIEAWNERNIKITNDHVSLVCVYLHYPEDDVRFVGHTGILLNANDSLIFIEKYSNLAPFQVTKFKNKAELKDYLLSRKDLYGDDNEMKPIITINGELLN